jgi:PAB-dependent poly(A)-specific ribonuclease subunit 3
MAGREQPQKKLSASIHAQPFKPSAAASGAKTALLNNVNAPAFVPGGSGASVPAPATTQQPGPGQTATNKASKANPEAGTTSFKNVNAQPFMPGKKPNTGEASASESAKTKAGSDLPDLPDELTEGVGEETYLQDPEEDLMYLNPDLYDADELGYGIDAVLEKLTVSDVSKAPRPGHSKVASQFMSEQLIQYLNQRQQLIFAHIQAKNQFGIPEYIHIYHSLLPLEDITRLRPSAALQISTKVFKGVSSSDGYPYALWRLNETQVAPTRETFQEAKGVIKKWSVVANYPHIVGLRDAFLSNEYGGQAALYMVYDFHPKAATIEKVYIRANNQSPIPEDVLWSFAVQLANLLLFVHSHGLSLGPSLTPSKLLITNKIRIRANVVGMHNLIQKDKRQSLQEQQAEDLWRVGQLLLLMACRMGNSGNNLEIVERHYSQQFSQLLQNILTIQKGILPNGSYLAHLLGQHAFTELSKINMLNDMLYENLYKELQNGRLLRLLVKLGMINERPDDSTSMQWADSGDRYLLKLFRDFMFHQKTEDGRPNLDFGHVVESLNKLDAGVPEQMQLLSRDEKSVLVVSYKDMKQAIISAYDELNSRANPKQRQW